ncbi:DUF2259 domain-containing protein [Agrobacterium sp. a22-2]|uniref:DUF2259 domain-containing protein n=1 Tax=Agrobacterium sp. a22-2 TaxID=2283840 RepID=UPI001445B4EF|nr:DUF2259 domain-containing protein [Agrobacterium sp. a22-2]NKN36517.1 DUF2259 domain-containing protein [Agrobacterium sp. a22-2]
MRVKRLAAAVLAALLAGPVSAGDIAAFSPIGFSPDGSIFAFEEYGIQDGSGFPYSNIYAINTVDDTFLPGTPIRTRIDNEQAGVGAARAESLVQAQVWIAKHKLTDHPGQMVAFDPVSEVGADPHSIRYRPFPAEPAIGEPFTLQIEELEEAPPAACKDVVKTVKGFRLLLTERDGAAVKETVYQDSHVPASRNCPTGYRLGGVMTFQPTNGDTLHIALVMVMSHGFEGRDGRWIALPVRP